MDIPIEAKVLCVNDEVGKSTRLIIDPVTERVTHLVVQENEFPQIEKLVPVEQVIESNPNEASR